MKFYVELGRKRSFAFAGTAAAAQPRGLTQNVWRARRADTHRATRLIRDHIHFRSPQWIFVVWNRVLWDMRCIRRLCRAAFVHTIQIWILIKRNVHKYAQKNQILIWSQLISHTYPHLICATWRFYQKEKVRHENETKSTTTTTTRSFDLKWHMIRFTLAKKN